MMDLAHFLFTLNTSNFSKYDLKCLNGKYHLVFSSYTSITDEQIYKIISLIQFPQLVSLTVALKNHLHFNYLVKMLDENYWLKKLNLSDSKFLDVSTVPWVADTQVKYSQLARDWRAFWNSSSSLEELYLNNCQIELDIFKIMIPEANPTLKIKSLFLNNNPLGNPTLEYLSTVDISGWKTLQHLEVENCNFNGTDVNFNFDILKQLPILHTLKMGHNSIGDISFVLLFDDMIHHQHLGTVSLQKSNFQNIESLNHCLRIIGSNPNIINFNVENNYLAQHAITHPPILRNLSVSLFCNRLRSLLTLILAEKRKKLPRLPSEVWEQLVAFPYFLEPFEL
jgi:hypothetical protein